MSPEQNRSLVQLRRVLAHIHSHFDQPLSLEKLSEIADMSTFHLQRVFRRAMGHSPAQRVQLLRLKRASMRLVFDPRRAITDIAFEAGYQNAESFTRAFRKCVAQSPREFRAEPAWPHWRAVFTFSSSVETLPVQVEIVQFP
jgi:AraC family transcriptional regulator